MKYPIMQSNRKPLIDAQKYELMYEQSMSQPDEFWADQADQFISWDKKWDKVSDVDFSKGKIAWFEGATLNVSYNCLDRHLAERANQVAIIWEGDDPDSSQSITYKELHEMVCKFSNGMKDLGVEKGDRICLYMPMIIEATVAMLACARLGAIHSVVFGGFSPDALRDRILDSECKLVITSDEGVRGGKSIPLKANVDIATKECDCVEHIVVVKRTGNHIGWSKRDIWYHELVQDASSTFPCEMFDAETPLFILYTSGSTGKPKGVLHTSGGYLLYAAMTHKYTFDYQEGDIYWCTADVGWVTGHSYIVYGPLANGATSLMFEGIPNYPDASRFWQVIDKHQVNIFYTAPTAIRALAKHPKSFVSKYDLNSLKVLGTVGEPINEEAWNWYNEVVGKKSCPIVDTWWQTETGGIMISSIAGVTDQKPTFATKPMIGIQPVLLDNDGQEISDSNTNGILAIKYPWPSIARTIYGDRERYKKVYFTAYPGYYFPGDGAFRDDDENYRITGRVDDVVIVSGHNLGTAPIEDAINLHENVVESALVGFPHDVKGNALYAFVILKDDSKTENINTEINDLISKTIGPIAKPDKVQIVPGLPKTRSGKIMRRILRKIACGEKNNFGDISTLLNPEIVELIVKGY